MTSTDRNGAGTELRLLAALVALAAGTVAVIIAALLLATVLK